MRVAEETTLFAFLLLNSVGCSLLAPHCVVFKCALGPLGTDLIPFSAVGKNKVLSFHYWWTCS